MTTKHQKNVVATVGNGTKDHLFINVTGRVFDVLTKTLLEHPNTRLGRIAQLHSRGIYINPNSDLYDDYSIDKDEYYFERNPDVFPTILDRLKHGQLHIPRNLCAEVVEQEAVYWGVQFNFNPCCEWYRQQEFELTESIHKSNEMYQKQLAKHVESKIELESETKWQQRKRRLWDLFENPGSSTAAWTVSLVSTLFVVISTVALCLNTVPDLKTTNDDGTVTENPSLVLTETICVVWFTFEYIVRILTCPDKRIFLKGALNTIDVLAVLPYYVGLIIEVFASNEYTRFNDVRRFLQILRIFRTIRIFKVARHSVGLQVLGYTVRQSSAELSLLFLLLIMGMTLFSSLVYFAEEGCETSPFTSIIQAFWWAIITMTTVGYGDMYPHTPLGKIVGSICCISGILFIALPIPTIVSNFSSFYKDHMNKSKLAGAKSDGETSMLSSSSDLLGSVTRRKSSQVNPLQQALQLGSTTTRKHSVAIHVD